ncbi:hypothetical protein DPMN_101351 [Dreissena polymorpha]|uniref:Uncharacterized protein n=1 Tax=Dreissena polymorpha TaxID=45954 RepID=A0A9D4LIZ1_DREPO|nr:hypothetical protein DPMN_101351 [Dreissena polymorpha]
MSLISRAWDCCFGPRTGSGCLCVLTSQDVWTVSPEVWEFSTGEKTSGTGCTRTTGSADVKWSAISKKTTTTTAIEPPHERRSKRVETRCRHQIRLACRCVFLLLYCFILSSVDVCFVRAVATTGLDSYSFTVSQPPSDVSAIRISLLRYFTIVKISAANSRQ